MDSKIIEQNNKIRSAFREMAFEIFKPEDAKVYDTLEVPEHYTVVYFIPDHIRQRIINISKEISAIDDSIVLNPPEKYHITLFSCPISSNIDAVKEVLAKHFESNKFQINLTNVITGALGVSIAGFPESYNFVELRQDLYQVTDQEFPTDYRASACWILLGRFSQPPKMEVIEYVRNNFDRDFGSMEIESYKILRNSHKILEGATEV